MVFCSTPGFPLCPLKEEPLTKQVFLSPSPTKPVAHRPRGGLPSKVWELCGAGVDLIKNAGAVKEALVTWLRFQGQVGKESENNPDERFLLYFTQRTGASDWLRGQEPSLALPTRPRCHGPPKGLQVRWENAFGKAWKGYIALYRDHFPRDALLSRNIEASEKVTFCPRSYLKITVLCSNSWWLNI